MQFSVEVETSKPARSLQEVWCKTSGERNVGVAALLIRVSQQTKRWVQKKWKQFSVQVISGAVRNMLCKPVFEEKKAEYVFLCNWYCYFFFPDHQGFPLSWVLKSLEYGIVIIDWNIPGKCIVCRIFHSSLLERKEEESIWHLTKIILILN